MSSTLPATAVPKIQSLLNTISQILGVDFTLAANNWRITLTGCPEGQDVHVSAQPGEGGAVIDKTVPNALLTDASGGGSLDQDIVEGTGAVMVAGTIDVTVSGGVPATARCYAMVTAAGGTVGHITAARKDANTITISSSNALETSTCSWVVVRP